MALRVHGTDPSALLQAAFERIERECMAGLPLLNPALHVQALGFERWQGHWLGAVVTPWFLNLVLVPGDASTWRAATEGDRVFHHLGAGDFAFLGACEPELGDFQSCSLFSPMPDFVDQASACATALAALRMLQVDQPAAALLGSTPACARTSTEPPATLPSRRAMLFGGRARRSDPA